MKTDWIEIFRAGKRTDMHGTTVDFSAPMVEKIAAAYDPAVSRAPVVIGHPQDNLPAYAQVQALKAVDGVLYYRENDAQPAFDAMRAAGRFKKRSASFYLPGSPGNPTPGQMYLRHVGWLGAMPPAVKGLADVAFAGDARGVVSFADDLPHMHGAGLRQALLRAVDGLAERRQHLPPPPSREALRAAGLLGGARAPAAQRTDADRQAQRAELDARAARLDEELAVLAQRRAQMDQALAQQASEQAATDYAERQAQARTLTRSLVRQGVLHAHQARAFAALVEALPAQPLAFADDEGNPVQRDPLAVLTDLTRAKWPVL